MANEIKLHKRITIVNNKEYAIYYVFLPRGIVEAIGKDIEKFEVRVVAEEGQPAILLVPKRRLQSQEAPSH